MSLTQMTKYLMNNKTFMKNTIEITGMCLEQTNNNMDFACRIVKLYTKCVHDLFEDNQHYTEEFKEHMLKAMDAGWWIDKLQKDSRKRTTK